MRKVERTDIVRMTRRYRSQRARIKAQERWILLIAMARMKEKESV